MILIQRLCHSFRDAVGNEDDPEDMLKTILVSKSHCDKEVCVEEGVVVGAGVSASVGVGGLGVNLSVSL